MATTPVTQRTTPGTHLGPAVATFIGVAFGFSWLAWLPLMLAGPTQAMPWYFYLGSLGPALGAIAAALVRGGKAEVSSSARRTFAVRGIRTAIIVALVTIALYFGLAVLVEQFATGSLARLGSTGLTSSLPGFPAWLVLVVWVVTFGVGEETGWRGWLMPSLNDRFGFSRAALLVAAAWMAWHAPQFVFNPGFHSMGWSAAGWAIALVAGSFWLGWLARLGRWSIVPVVIWHGAFDFLTSSDLGPSTFAATVSTLVIVQAAVIVVVISVRGLHARRVITE
jgi:uncharacterized protein